VVKGISVELEQTDDNERFNELCMLETTNGDPDDGDQDVGREGHRKPRRDGVSPEKFKNRWPTVQVPANEVGTAFQDFEAYLCSRLKRRFITQWPTVLAIVVDLRTSGERKFDVPFEFEVRETAAHSAISYGLIACIKGSSMLVRSHSTTFVLSAADDDGRVWSLFDDDKPVRSAYTEPGPLHQFVRIGFFLRR
jgi:hypothetical protein